MAEKRKLSHHWTDEELEALKPKWRRENRIWEYATIAVMLAVLAWLLFL